MSSFESGELSIFIVSQWYFTTTFTECFHDFDTILELLTDNGSFCVEYWLAKCIENGMIVSVAPRSGLLDTDVPIQEKIYGYHRLDNPTLVLIDEDKDEFYTMGFNEYSEEVEKRRREEAELISTVNTPPEAKRY